MRKTIGLSLVCLSALSSLSAEVRVLPTDEIPSVANRTGTVQERLIDVRSAIHAAKRGAAKGTKVLLVGKNGNLLDDQAFNAALGHFEGGDVFTAMPADALKRLSEIAALPDRPSTVVPDGRKWRTDTWSKRCIAKQAEIAANESHVFDIVFFGDSITHNWERDDAWGVYAQYGGFGKQVWTEAFKDLRVLNIGIGGDRTQDLLWRGLNGDLDNYKAKMFVVMIGTNNVRVNSPEEIAEGVKAVVELVKAKHPESKILLYAIFPRGEKANDALRAKNEKANAVIEKLADGETVIWRNINAKFLEPDGSMTREMMPDFLHPTPKGYRIWADDVKPHVAKFCAAKLENANFRYRESGISLLAKSDAAFAAKNAWRPSSEAHRPDAWIEPCAPYLHDGRINYFQEIRRRIDATNGKVGLALYYLGKLPKFDGALEIGVGETAAQYPWNAETGDMDGWKADWIAMNLDMTHEMHEKVAFRLFERTFRTVRAKHPEAKVMIVRAKPDGTDPEDEMWKRVVRFNFWAKGLCDSKTVFFCDYDKGDDVKARMQAILDGGRGMERKLAFPEYPETSLTLMTYNIHSGWGMYGQGWNLWDPIEVIKKVRPDVCTLNEVGWGGKASGFQVDQPTIMGHILNPMWRTVLGKAMERDGGDYGNVILHCAPALSEKVIALPGKKEPRSCVFAEFPDYWVGTSHFPLHKEFQWQAVPLIADFVKQQKKPVFLTGDWNAEPGTKTIELMAEHFVFLSNTNRFTFSSTRPHATIDYIAVDKAHADKVTVKSVSVVEEPHGSDHLPVVMKCVIRK